MTLFSQKYQNTIRTVSGTVSVEPADVVLNVTTATQAATINLQTFTDSYWSTQYKLYVVDASNLAGTNNITIVAPAGYTINGASSAVINTNGGSAIVRIVANGKYQAQLSSGGSGSATLPYLYSKKLLKTLATTYVAVAAGPVHSVVSGTTMATYDSSANSNIAGFVQASGIWTVVTSGYYSLGAKMITRINPDSVETTTNGSTSWMNTSVTEGGVGFISIGIIVRVDASTIKVVCAEKQAITQDIADVNIECSQNLYYLTAGDQVSVSVLNKTTYAIIGVPDKDSQPECILDFSAIKIG